MTKDETANKHELRKIVGNQYLVTNLPF